MHSKPNQMKSNNRKLSIFTLAFFSTCSPSSFCVVLRMDYAVEFISTIFFFHQTLAFLPGMTQSPPVSSAWVPSLPWWISSCIGAQHTTLHKETGSGFLTPDILHAINHAATIASGNKKGIDGASSRGCTFVNVIFFLLFTFLPVSCCAFGRFTPGS